MKKILGLDLGTNSIGWALVEVDEYGNVVKIIKLGSRIIPMDEKAMSEFNTGALKTQTAERTRLRGVRRLVERHLLRRERLHRVLNILGFLPEHYSNTIDFNKHFGKFKENIEPNLVYQFIEPTGKFEFIFKESFVKMVNEFKTLQPSLFYKKPNGEETKIPYDWTIYYLRKEALTRKIEKEELAWLLLNFNQKRGYYQLRGEDDEDATKTAKTRKYFDKQLITNITDTNTEYKGLKVLLVELANGNKGKIFKKEIPNWIGVEKNIIATVDLDKEGKDKFEDKGLLSQRFAIPTDTEWETEWKLIKLKTEKDLSDSNKTVGCYIYDTLLQNPTQKINGKLVRTIERKFYKQELEAILKCQQEFHPELQNKELYAACLEELYENNDNHRNNIGNKDFAHLFLNDIIFYQRPLKSKKSLISNCPYESRTFIKDGVKETQGIKCIAKSNPLFQEFRLWQFLQNLKIYEKEKLVGGKLQTDVDVTHEFLKTDEDWVNLFEWLNERKNVEQSVLLTSYFKIKKAKGATELPYRWNYVEDKEYPCNETRAAILSKLKNCTNILCDFLTRENESALWHLLYSVEDTYEIQQALPKFAERYGLGEDFVNEFKKFPPFKKDYGSYSEKAIKKLLPLMRRGKYWDKSKIHPQTIDRINKIIAGEYDEKIRNRVREKTICISSIDDCKNLPLWLACYIVYDRHSESGDIKHWKTPGDIEWYLNQENPERFKQHSLRNPIVEQIITETLRVVKDIWKHLGNSEPDFFKEIHVELGREMKNTKDDRERITKQISENENTNLRIKKLLIEMMNDSDFEDVRPYSPSQQEILKIYEEGVLSQYSETELKNEKIEDIDISKVAKSSNPTTKELEKYKLWLSQKYKSPYTGKVIPLSKLFTPAYQIEHIIPQSRYFDDSFTNKVICEAEVNKDKDKATGYEYIKHNHGKIIELNYGEKVKICEVDEYEQLVKEMYANNRGKMKRLLMEDVPDDFINRQLNDSRYISKVIKSMLSNIVREEGEEEATSKHVLSTNGSITSTLKQDWGLNDVWNTIITPRFERLNALTNSNNFGSWTNKEGKRVFQTDMPLELQKGFTKKRIDHRHHALDALVIACATRNHINFMNNESAKASKKDTRHELRNLLCHKKCNNDSNNNYKWVFNKPWETFTQDTFAQLQTTIVSFKQNLRVINKTVNYYQHWKINDNGTKEKVIEKQTKGDSWAIRKSMHAPMPYGEKTYDFDILKICENIGKREYIIDLEIREEVYKIVEQFKNKISDAQKFLKTNPIMDKNNNPIFETAFKIKTEKFRRRQPISKLSNRGQGGIKTTENAINFINKVVDFKLRNELLLHLKESNNDIDIAFSADGIEKFNAKRKIPVYNLPIAEEGEKRFALGLNPGNKHKFVEADKGTNLFFAIYWNEESKKREFETIPLNEVIEHQKLVAHLPKNERTPVPVNKGKGQFLFSLSPDDLVYVPNEVEQEHPNIVDFNNLTQEQAQRVYKMVSCTGKECHFIKEQIASLIKSYDAKSKTGELGSLNKLETTIEGTYRVKEVCWKLQVDRLGKIVRVIK